MIELRWYTPAPTKFTDAMGIEQSAAGLTVLQYRTRQFRAAPPFNAGFEGWGAWQDVPSVSENTPIDTTVTKV